MVQFLEYLPCKHEDLSSIPSIWVEGTVYLYFQGWGSRGRRILGLAGRSNQMS